MCRGTAAPAAPAVAAPVVREPLGGEPLESSAGNGRHEAGTHGSGFSWSVLLPARCVSSARLARHLGCLPLFPLLGRTQPDFLDAGQVQRNVLGENRIALA